MMENSANLSLSYVMPQQAQKHVTVNETFRRLDAVVQLTAKSRSAATQPLSPADGDRYILPPSATGDFWSGEPENQLVAYQDGSWVAIAPKAGWRCFVEDEASLRVFDGSAWSAISGQSASDRVGINTTADATNRLAVKSDAVLFSHDDVTPGNGSMRLVLNKAETAATTSLLFQAAFGGIVEQGLLGDDQFTIQVSDDQGQSFEPAVTISPDGAETWIKSLSVGNHASLAQISLSTASSPHWAIGQASDESFFIQRLPGGFGTGGKVLIYSADGALGLWGAPSSLGKISVVSNINVDNVDNILGAGIGF